MNGEASESSYIRAAEHITDELKTRLDKAEKSAKRRTFWQWMIGIGLIISLVTGAVTTSLYLQNRTILRQQQQQNIAQCQSGNDSRAKIVKTFNFFIAALVSQPVSSEVRNDVAAAKKFLVALAGADPQLRAQAIQLGTLLERFSGQHKDPNLATTVKRIEDYISGINAPRNCVALYSVSEVR